MTTVYLSLGGNLGDRGAYLRAAIRALSYGPRLRLLGVSRAYETAPVEVKGDQPPYLNCVAALECGISPIELLRYTQGVEAALGREKKGEKAPRTVDIDLLLFGGEHLKTSELTIPHPGILRPFNLKCLAELDGGLEIPGAGSVGGLLAKADMSGVTESEEGIGPC